MSGVFVDEWFLDSLKRENLQSLESGVLLAMYLLKYADSRCRIEPAQIAIKLSRTDRGSVPTYDDSRYSLEPAKAITDCSGNNPTYTDSRRSLEPAKEPTKKTTTEFIDLSMHKKIT